MVIVATDDLNLARSWFEQVQPKLAGPINSENHSPFLMVTSSQLESVIHPYFETSPQKLNGYISGLKGFTLFGSASNSDQDTDLWDRYSRGISISFLILLIGSIYQLFASVITDKQRQQDT